MISFIIKNLRTNKNEYCVDGNIVSKKEYNRLRNQYKKKVKFFFNLPKSQHIYNEYRIDIGMWEEKLKLMNFINLYKYKIGNDGKITKFSRLFRYKRNTAKIIQCTKMPVCTLNKNEFQEKYKGNKWLIPINKILEVE